jgi:hypothetical protein
MRPLNHLTEQAKFSFSEANEATPRGHSRPNPSPGGLAASYVASPPSWPIVIWYGEELTA